MAGDDHEKHYSGMVAQKAFIEQGGKVLLVQYPPQDPAALLWDLPGGRLNIGETAEEGLKREVREEIGAEIRVDGVIAATMNHGPMFEAYFVIFRASLVNPEQKFSPEAGEIGQIAWHDKKDILTLPLAASGVSEVLRDLMQKGTL